MLKLILYQNCILNDSYSEVFDNYFHYKKGMETVSKTAFEHYLEGLDSIEIDCGNIYLTNSGIFKFDMYNNHFNPPNIKSVYSYNYMKIIDDHMPEGYQVRYAFVNSASIVNALLVINYKEDVWANYSEVMTIRNCILSRSYQLDYNKYKIPFYSLPLLYSSNNALKTIPIDTDPNVTNKGYILVQLQCYQPDVEGKVTPRISRLGLFGYTKDYTNLKENPIQMKFDCNNDTLNKITNILKFQARGILIFKETENAKEKITHRFDVLNIYFVPASVLDPVNNWDNSSFSNENTELGNIIDTDTLSSNEGYYFANFCKITEDTNEIIQTKSISTGSFPDNKFFKYVSVGPYTNQTEITYNGTAVNGTIGFSKNDFEFKLFMNIQNKLIEITNSFEINFPISSITADALQLRSIARQVENTSLENSKIQSGLSIGSSLLGITSGLAGAGAGAATGNPIMALSGISQSIGGAMGIGSGILGISQATNKSNLANAKSHVSSKPVTTTQTAIINCAYGFVFFAMQPDNEKEVEQFLEESGYEVNEMLNFNPIKVSFKNKIDHRYNILKFDFIRMHGEFPQDIMKELENICMNGFKIWYDDEMI